MTNLMIQWKLYDARKLPEDLEWAYISMTYLGQRKPVYRCITGVSVVPAKHAKWLRRHRGDDMQLRTDGGIVTKCFLEALRTNSTLLNRKS